MSSLELRLRRSILIIEPRSEYLWRVVSWNLSVFQVKRVKVVANSLGQRFMPVVVYIKHKQAGRGKFHWLALLVHERELELRFRDRCFGVRRRKEIELETVPQRLVLFRLRRCVLILSVEDLHNKIKLCSVHGGTNFAEPDFLRGVVFRTLTSKVVRNQFFCLETELHTITQFLGARRRAGGRAGGCTRGGAC